MVLVRLVAALGVAALCLLAPRLVADATGVAGRAGANVIERGMKLPTAAPSPKSVPTSTATALPRGAAQKLHTRPHAK